jgi:hypothetical protein
MHHGVSHALLRSVPGEKDPVVGVVVWDRHHVVPQLQVSSVVLSFVKSHLGHMVHRSLDEIHNSL